MYFKLTFTTDNVDQMLIGALGRPGLDMLDAVREDYPDLAGLKARSIDIYAGCPINGHTVDFDITEEQARASGLFRGNTEIQVQVPEHFFSRYVRCDIGRRYDTYYIRDAIRIGPWCLRGARTEQVLSGASTENEFDKDCLMKEWGAAGFPTNWL
ncbi:hypothetical protein DRQ25_10625 [Candidatus Fermentibacteria bacterium]|nr:MAG: hypothetical protein DRQ25_10625 [Candidatus Fermentibacteria bacterium]